MSGGRVLLAWALSAALWAAGGALVFLVGPVVSALPSGWGALAGTLALLLQVAFGERLVRSLLRLTPGPAPDAVVIEEERPFLLALGAGPQLVPTTGLLDRLPAEVPELERDLADRRKGASGFLLTRALALPCLFRAFHAATEHYARLRGGAGPLYVLGRAFLAMAGVLEAPLGILHLSPPVAGETARLRLEALLARHAEIPAWMEALGPLAPVTIGGARRRAQMAALRAGPPSEDPLPQPRRAWQRLLPLMAFLAGLLVTMLPQGPLAAPVVFLAFGLAARRLWELPRGPAVEADLEALALRSASAARAVPVRLSGTLGDRPPDLAVPEGSWLDTGAGRIRLNGLHGGMPGPLELTGWMMPQAPEILVGEIWQDGRRRRTWPLARRLLVPLELALLGGTWWMLQVVGL